VYGGGKKLCTGSVQYLLEVIASDIFMKDKYTQQNDSRFMVLHYYIHFVKS